jgi:hypothetical protein
MKEDVKVELLDGTLTIEGESDKTLAGMMATRRSQLARHRE